MDRLSALLSRFSLHAGLFHNGALCGVASFGESGVAGHLHLLRRGRLKVVLDQGRSLQLDEPTLLFFPCAAPHRFIAQEDDHAELVCASLLFNGGHDNPIARALPDHLALPLARLDPLQATLDWLFDEAFGEHCGKAAVVNRLCELLVIQLLRHLMETGHIQSGMLAGLSDPRLAQALIRLHAEPAAPWTLEAQATAAGMSRARYAAYFKDVIGDTPADYLLRWRVALAQKLLREGRPIKLVAGDVGYDSPSALARAFKRIIGIGPAAWARSAREAG